MSIAKKIPIFVLKLISKGSAVKKTTFCEINAKLSPAVPVENFSDAGNAEKLVKFCGDRIRYCHAFRKWLVFDGLRWVTTPNESMIRLALETIRHMVSEAESLPSDLRSRMLRHSLASESLGRLTAMVSLAGALLPIQPGELDRNPLLLNLINGTLDLSTGKLRKHNSGDFITKLAPVKYDHMAKCSKFLGFIKRIMGRDKPLLAYLQRAVGYSLTSQTKEQCFFFLHGRGANGKTVLLNTLRNILGDYALQSPPELLLTKDRQGGATPELARLPGARLVCTSETEDGHRFAENTIKQLTGGDVIAARHLYGELFEFKPTFKIWLAANHKPIIRGTDLGIWRRIHLIPFNVTIPQNEQDKNLETKLMDEWPGILNWSIAGCRKWITTGLQPPDAVVESVDEYRTDMDTFGEFLNECCVLDAQAITTANELYLRYKFWAEQNIGKYMMSPNSFGRHLSERGFRKIRDAHTKSWKGIRIRGSELVRSANPARGRRGEENGLDDLLP